LTTYADDFCSNAREAIKKWLEFVNKMFSHEEKDFVQDCKDIIKDTSVYN